MWRAGALRPTGLHPLDDGESSSPVRVLTTAFRDEDVHDPLLLGIDEPDRVIRRERQGSSARTEYTNLDAAFQADHRIRTFRID